MERDADMAAFNAHLKHYGDMYDEAEDLIDLYVLSGWHNWMKAL